MIISFSRRTDGPAYYSNWFFDKLEKGFVEVPNPFNPKQISRVSLLPEAVDCFVFWTRNPRPLTKRLNELERKGYRRYYFLVTANAYPRLYEPRVPSREEAAEAIAELSRKIGRERVVWRYDPIFVDQNLTFDFHKKNFRSLAEKIIPNVSKVIVSILSPYKKTVRGLNGVVSRLVAELWDKEETVELLTYMKKIAESDGLPLEICSPAKSFENFGIRNASCVDIELINKNFGLNLKFKKDRNQRPSCGCSQSKDIGFYDSCRAGCVYCYATNPEKAKFAKIS